MYSRTISCFQVPTIQKINLKGARMMNNDHLEKINNEIIERRLLKVDKQFTVREIQQLKKMIEESPTGFIIPMEPSIKHLKVKKDIPTVVEYQGRRYILDDSNR
jgi:hypothetical protein